MQFTRLLIDRCPNYCQSAYIICRFKIDRGKDEASIRSPEACLSLLCLPEHHRINQPWSAAESGVKYERSPVDAKA
jgi:hypothetical protein